MKFCIRLTLFALTVLLISSNVAAQKIKIKKDILYIDKQKTPIAINIKHKSVENMGDFHQIYTFTDRSSNTVFLYVDYIGYMIPGIAGKLSWLEISDANRHKTNSIDFEGGLFSSKNKIVLALLNKYQFFNREGVVNQQNIDNFFSSNTRSLVKEQATKEVEKTAKLREFDPHIGLDLSIRKGGVIGDAVGRVEVPEKHDSMKRLTYGVYDLDDNLIASANIYPNNPMVKVSFIDGKHSEYRSRFGLSSQIGDRSFLEELIERIFVEGYHLGHQYNEADITSDTEANPAS